MKLENVKKELLQCEFCDESTKEIEEAKSLKELAYIGIKYRYLDLYKYDLKEFDLKEFLNMNPDYKDLSWLIRKVESYQTEKNLDLYLSMNPSYNDKTRGIKKITPWFRMVSNKNLTIPWFRMDLIGIIIFNKELKNENLWHRRPPNIRYT